MLDLLDFPLDALDEDEGGVELGASLEHHLDLVLFLDFDDVGAVRVHVSGHYRKFEAEN